MPLPTDVHEPLLADLGWTPFFAAQVSPAEARACVPARVMAVHRGELAVAGAGFEVQVSSWLTDGAQEDGRATVGDWVLVDRDSLAPVRVLDRASLFKRQVDARAQLVAANVDTVLIVASCNQDFNVARLERYLVLAREVGVRPVVVLTKIDLADAPEIFASAARRLQAGLQVELVNAREPNDVARLAGLCGPGETVALLGSSGVGKSTLVNTLRGSDSIATQAVREGDGKGRHTTTVRQMYRLAHGGWLLDTPGMREFRMAEAAQGLAEVFDDIAALTLDCRFANCTHASEPGCAVQAALVAGTLGPERLARWRKLMAEDAGDAPARRTRTSKPQKKDVKRG